ncbi:MAG TPA: hypothetical protein VMH30_14720 [Verrucomicrobiae bacterium]|nr:hypothetical protein [Verrucomicrobiae bacterium]
MKTRYCVFRRSNGIFFLEDRLLKKQNSLKTRDAETARRICHAKNEALRQPAINLQIARAYLMASDPLCVNRTWQNVMESVAETKRANTLLRWERAMKEAPFDLIRGMKLIETQPDHFSRRLHNFALGMDWLPKAIIPQRRWPKIEFREKRGITREEHEKILAGERNSEWRAYYSLLWHLGGSQSDIAVLRGEDVDWEMQVVGFCRMKTGSVVQIHFGPEIAGILNDLPGEGFIFPRIAAMKETDRAKAFISIAAEPLWTTFDSRWCRLPTPAIRSTSIRQNGCGQASTHLPSHFSSLNGNGAIGIRDRHGSHRPVSGSRSCQNHSPLHGSTVEYEETGFGEDVSAEGQKKFIPTR